MRYLSIDILRALAILLMIQVHFVDNLSSRTDAHAWLYDVSAWLGMLPAPLFTLLAGVSYGLWLRRQEAAGRCDAEITRISVRRGLFLFGAGIAFNVFVWLPEDTFDWDILTMIGSALVLLAFARKLPPGVVVLMCVMVLLLSPLLRVAAEYSAYWEDDEYLYDFTLEDVVFGFFSNGYFPLLPWIIFPFMGFVISDSVFPPSGRPARLSWWVVLTGSGLMVLSLACFLIREMMPMSIRDHYLTGFTIFPASTEYTIGMLGLSMACVVLLSRWIDQNEGITRDGWFLGFVRLYSAYSLTIYVVHHMVHLWPLWVYGTWMQQEPTHYWRQAIGTPAALGLAVLCMAGCYGLASFLDRHGRIGFESVMRWVCE